MVLLLVDQKSHKQFVYCKFVLTTCPLARKQVFTLLVVTALPGRGVLGSCPTN